MESSGPMISMPAMGIDMYSPKRSSYYHGGFPTQDLSALDFWDVPKQEPLETGTEMNSIPPRFEPVVNNVPYTCTQEVMPNMKDDYQVPSASNGLGLYYPTTDGYGDSLAINDPISPLFDTTNTIDPANFSCNEQHLQNIDSANVMGFQNNLDGGVGDLSIPYTSNNDYTSAQAIASPSQNYGHSDYEDPQLACTGSSLTSPLEVQCQTTSVVWRQDNGEGLGNQTQVSMMDQTFSIQPESWSLNAENVCSHDPTLFTALPPAGSPFENSPLSSLNVTPQPPQSTWDNGYSSNFLGVDQGTVWPSMPINNLSTAEDVSLPILPGPQLVKEVEVASSDNKYEMLVTVMEVGIKTESESPPAEYQPRMDDLIGNFDSSPTAASRKRKRTKFTTEGAEKVRGVRNKGACVACHYRKTPVRIDRVLEDTS